MISIVVPVFNALSTLGQCIESILAQSYTDFELLLVNDGSTDNSGSICNHYAAQDSRVRAIHQKNQGASLARRNGVEQSHGEYLAFVDADDFLEVDYLARLMDALNRHAEVRIAACGVAKHRKGEKYVIPALDAVSVLDSDELHRRFFSYEFWGFWGKLYHRSVFDDVYFPDYTINEDYVVMAQLFHKYQKMVFVEALLYHYILSDTGLSHQRLSSRAMDEYYNKLWVLEYYELGMRSEEFGIRNEWKRCAEAQLTETCIKLTRMIREAGRPQAFAGVDCEMRAFLRSHLFAILRNPHLLIGLKVMAVKSIL